MSEDLSDHFVCQLEKHFSAGELVEYLDLSVRDLVDKLRDEIMACYSSLVTETCFEFTSLEDDDDEDWQ